MNFRQEQRINTLQERQNLLDAGSIELTPSEIYNALLALGFKFDNSMGFNYYNTGNEVHYLAKSVYIIDIKRKISFASIDFGIGVEESDRREALQKIRRSSHGWDGTRIIEL